MSEKPEKKPLTSSENPAEQAPETVATRTQKRLDQLKADISSAKTKDELARLQTELREVNEDVQAYEQNHPDSSEIQPLKARVEELEGAAERQGSTIVSKETAEVTRLADTVAPGTTASTLGTFTTNISSMFTKGRDFVAKTFGSALSSIRQSLKDFVNQPFVKEWMPWLEGALSSIGLVENLVGKSRINLFNAASQAGVAIETSTDADGEALNALLTTIDNAGLADNELFFKALMGAYKEAGGPNPVNISQLAALVTPAFIEQVKAATPKKQAEPKPAQSPQETPVDGASAVATGAAAETVETSTEQPVSLQDNGDGSVTVEVGEESERVAVNGDGSLQVKNHKWILEVGGMKVPIESMSVRNGALQLVRQDMWTFIPKQLPAIPQAVIANIAPKFLADQPTGFKAKDTAAGEARFEVIA